MSRDWIRMDQILANASMACRLDQKKFEVLRALEALVDEGTVCEADFDNAKLLIKFIRTGES